MRYSALVCMAMVGCWLVWGIAGSTPTPPLLDTMVGLAVAVWFVGATTSKAKQLADTAIANAISEWCMGCREVHKQADMAWTETGLYRCTQCRTPPKAQPKPPSGGGGVTVRRPHPK